MSLPGGPVTSSCLRCLLLWLYTFAADDPMVTNEERTPDLFGQCHYFGFEQVTCRLAVGRQETQPLRCLFQHMHRATGLSLPLKTGWE